MPTEQQPLPWDIIDRCLLPVVFSHAAAVILSTILNTLRISQVSTFTLFLLFVITSLSVVIFYHTLKVTAAGKSVLVIGCDTRLGAALVRQLDDIGFTVFAGYHDNAVDARALKSECSGRVRILPLDVTSDKDVQAALRYITDNADGLWAVVNQPSPAMFGEVEWIQYSGFQRTVEVNLLGAVRIAQAFLPLLRRSKGRLVTVASLLGRVPAQYRAAHCAAQAAVLRYTQVLRLEMRRWGVDVVLVEPADFTTGCSGLSNEQLLQQCRDLWQQLSPALQQDYGQEYFEQTARTLQQYVKPNDVDLTGTLRSLVDAVTRTFPLANYTPITGSERLQAAVADHLPRSVYDVIYT